MTLGAIIADDVPNKTLTLARRAAQSLRAAADSTDKRLHLCLELLSNFQENVALSALAEQILQLEIDARHYWIGTFYTLLMPEPLRRSRAAYFTPPHIANGLLQLLRNEGFNSAEHSAIDPAAGGAAFLSTIAGQLVANGVDTTNIADRLRGIEIDPGLAKLSEALIGNRIGRRVPQGSLVKIQDSLQMKVRRKFDLTIANPPYGRVSPLDLPDKRWQEVCHPGHVNKYALFTELCFRLTKPGGLVALVIPSSYVAGPLYDRLRTFIRAKGEVLVIGSVTNRKDVFLDVAQDVSILVARAGQPHVTSKLVVYGSFAAFHAFKANSASVLPTESELPWITRAQNPELAIGGATLADYGAALRSGYFVWNRESARMSKRQRKKLDVPLVWAANIRAKTFCIARAKKGDGIDFVRFKSNSTAIVRSNAIIIQRTTNNSQVRRIVAARISPSMLKKWGGFVSENHTIVLTASSVSTLNALGLLLNSAAVDQRYRLLSGTASVSVTLLRRLDLPEPQALLSAIAIHGECEYAIEEAYLRSSRLRVAVSA